VVSPVLPAAEGDTYTVEVARAGGDGDTAPRLAGEYDVACGLVSGLEPGVTYVARYYVLQGGDVRDPTRCSEWSAPITTRTWQEDVARLAGEAERLRSEMEELRRHAVKQADLTRCEALRADEAETCWNATQVAAEAATRDMQARLEAASKRASVAEAALDEQRQLANTYSLELAARAAAMEAQVRAQPPRVPSAFAIRS
jgi:hypothetical protein